MEHREGTKMRHVATLSRANGILILEENTFEQNLSIAQNLDPVIHKIKTKLQDTEDKDFVEVLRTTINGKPSYLPLS